MLFMFFCERKNFSFCPSNLGYVLSGPRVLATFTRLLSIANPPFLSMDSTVTFSVMGLPDNVKRTSSPSLSFLISFFSFSYLFYLEIFFMQIYEIILYLLHYLFYFYKFIGIAPVIL